MRALAIGTFLPALLACVAAGRAESFLSFYATEVIDYAPGRGNEGFPDPGLALGGPRGAGGQDSGTHVVTLGLQGSLTLGFADPGGRGRIIADGPGADLIVFENPFVDGRTGLVFGELVRVRVSSDALHFAEFPTWCGETFSIPPTGPDGTIFPELYSGFAGVNPVRVNVTSSGPAGQRDPFDPAQAGGDAFDLADLADVPEVLGGLVDPNAIRYVRLVDVRGDGAEADSDGNAIYDPTGEIPDWPDDDSAWRPLSADIDAVSVIHGSWVAGPTPGDADEDGGVDHLDYVTLKRHVGAGPDAAWRDGDFTGDGFVTRADFALLREHFGVSLVAAAPAPEPASVLLFAAAAAAALRRRRHGRNHGA